MFLGYSFGAGEDTTDEKGVLDALKADFAAADHDVIALMTQIALTHGFRATSGPRELSAEEGL